MERKFGWKRQLPDIRDINFMHLPGIELVKKRDLPPHWNNQKFMPLPYDQLNLGACTGMAVSGLAQYDLIKQGVVPVFEPAQMFIYFNERLMEDTVETDSGAMIRDGIKSLNLYGFCPEALWPYDVKKFAVRPSDAAYAAAGQNKVAVKDYGMVPQDLYDMKVALVSGYPIAIGFTVYESFMSEEVAKSGLAHMPMPGEQVLGGHAVVIVGYEKRGWIVRNSWGVKWGMDGYFIMPFEYFTNHRLSSDLWILRMV